MSIVSVNQVIGKTLFAAKNVQAFSAAKPEKQYFLYTIKKGEPVGVVYSYVQDSKGVIWWMFYDKNNKSFYVIHTPDSFSLSALKEQGTKTEKEIQDEKDDEDKPWYEKILSDAGSFATKAAIGVGAFLIIRDVIKNKTK